MRILLALVILSVAAQGLATALRSQIRSLVGKKITGLSQQSLGSIVTGVDEFGRNALHHAVILGDLPLVEFFLANGVDTGATDNDDLIPLRYAEQLADEQPSVERMQIVSLVLEKTRGVNKGDEKGLRPIAWSIMAGDYPRITELITQKDADIFSGRTKPYQLAGRHNAVWAAETMQDDRAIKILAKHAPDKYFPPAVVNGYRKFIQEMIARDVDIDVRDDNLYTALMHAAKAGRIDDVQMLIAHGAKVDSDTLILAAYSGNPKLVQMILEYDVDVNAVASRTFPDRYVALTALEMVFVGESRFRLGSKVGKGRRKIIRMLLEHAADINFFAGNYRQLIPKIIAGNASAMEDLFTLYKLHKQGHPLQVAAYDGDPIVMKTILRYLADDHFLPQGIAALAIAKIHGRVGMVRMLIKHASAIGIDKDKFVSDANSLEELSASLHGGTSYHRSRNDSSFNNTLIEAMKKASVDGVQKLIDYGAVPERVADFLLYRSIHYVDYLSIQTSRDLSPRIKIMKMLANYWQEGFPLPFAVAKGDPQLVKKTIDERYNHLGAWEQAIRVAHFLNNDELLESLISHPQISEHLEMVARMAINNNYYKTLKLALDNGADPDGKRTDGYPSNLLAVAAKKNNLPMVELLLAHNADPNYTNTISVPPIIAVSNYRVLLDRLYDYVVSRGQQNVAKTRIKIIEKLVAAGADIDIVARGYTALGDAIMLYDVELVDTLLKLGADHSQSHLFVNRARRQSSNPEIGSKEKQEVLSARLDKIEQLLQR